MNYISPCFFQKKTFNILFLLLLCSFYSISQNATISGELKTFHKTTLTWSGITANESISTFKDYRLNVTFTSPSGKTFIVPGYYAADGNAAETSSTSGDNWRCHFNPLESGTWNYQASFRNGDNIAISFNENEGVALAPIDGDTGDFNISQTDKFNDDFRSKGKLEYVGEHFLKWTNGDYFLKSGSNSPETFLQYADFDDTPTNKLFLPHIADWNTGDPTWQTTKGKGIIGSVNYLNSADVNSLYFLIMGARGDNNTSFPWINSEENNIYDVSKLDQWQIVFDHMNEKGIMVHFILSEAENQSLFELRELGTSGGNSFADSRKRFYREMVARFGYLNAITWNVGEENGWDKSHLTYGAAVSSNQRIAFANYIRNLTYYNDHITVENGPATTDGIFNDLLGDNDYSGISVQGQWSSYNTGRARILNRLEQSKKISKKWVVTYDEPYTGGDTFPDEKNHRKFVIWGTLTAGGAGYEFYIGGRDWSLQDFRPFSKYWSQMKVGISLFENNDIPFQEMDNHDDLVTTGYCLAKTDESYVIYLENGGSTNIDLTNVSNNFSVKWYNPRTGGTLIDGLITTANGGSQVNLGNPPSDIANDWVIILKSEIIEPVPATGVSISPSVLEIGKGSSYQLAALVLPSNAIDPSFSFESSDTNIVSVNQDGLIIGVSSGNATVTARSKDGNFTSQSQVTVIDNSNFCQANGKILMERYDNISGTSIDDLFNAVNYPDNPDLTIELTSFQIPRNVANNYGCKVSGYLCAPETGTYYFWVSGDDNSRLNISSNSNQVNISTIANVPGWTSSEDWSRYSEQKSIGVFLTVGESYYIEAYMKEGGGGDNLAVGWRKPSDGIGSLPTEIIPGSVLSSELGLNTEVISVTDFAVNPKTLTLNIDETETISTLITPLNATNTNILWATSNSNIATVDQNGVVTAVSAGNVVITATTFDGGHTDTTTLTVLDNTTNNCLAEYEELDNILVIEAENINQSQWSTETNDEGYSGTGYIEWGNSRHRNRPGTGLIPLKIKINNPGVYKFNWRTKIGKGSSISEENDTWLRFPDASDNFATPRNNGQNGSRIYPLGSGKTPNPEGSGNNNWWKVYTNTLGWNWQTVTSDNNPHDIYVQFNTSGIYTIEISVRSQYHFIDRIVLSKSSISDETNLNYEETPCNGISYAINSNADVGGEITPYGKIFVSEGLNQTYSITANTGYAISDVIVDSVSQGPLDAYTFENIRETHTISALFSPISTFTISSSAAANGSISPLGDILVSQGTDQVYSITADAGYTISEVIVDDVYQGSLNSFTFNNVNQNHTISATFEEQDEFITFTLIDANTNTELFNIVNGAQISSNINDLFNIRANSRINVGSIGFVLSGALSHTRTESVAPYVLFGDEAGKYNGNPLPIGNYTLFANAYSGSGLTGNLIGTNSIQFSVINLDSYTINSSVTNTGGSITPFGDTPVTEGTNLSYIITADTGFTISEVIVDGISQGPLDSYTFNNVTENHEISVSFSPVPVFNITSSVAANGSISPTGDTLVSQGDDQVYSINADAGYTIDKVIVNGVDKGPLNSYTFENVRETHAISALFSPVPTFNITSSANVNGSINPLGDTLVPEGTDQAYSITADTGYSISRVIVDGVDQGPLNAFTFNNVNQNHTISATFEEQDEFITFTLIDANTNTELFNIVNGTQISSNINDLFNIRANSSINVGSIGFVLSDALSHTKTESVAPYALFGDEAGKYNGNPFPIGDYTLIATAYSGSGLTGNLIGTNSIQFSVVDLESYTINSAVTNTGGSITPFGDTLVTEGTNLSYTITTDTGFTISEVIVDGVDQGSLSSFTFNNVTKNHTISASFSPVSLPTFNISSSATANGSISPLGDTLVSQGNDQVYSIIADTGYKISEVIVDGVDQGSLSSFTFNSVNQNHTISALFSPVPTFNITSSANVNGSISPLGDILLSQGADQAYSINADTGYSISRVIVDGVDQGPLNAFTFNNVNQNHTISASFEEQDKFITFTLIDANTNTELFNIINGTQIASNINDLFNIRANSSINVGSIGFVLSGTLSHTKTESVAPYALFGDEAGKYNGNALPIGNYTLFATAYSGSGLTGNIIGRNSIKFSVIDLDSYTINSTVTNTGGSITPFGDTLVTEGTNLTYTITADTGFTISEVIVDGISQGLLNSYTFNNIDQNHTISASFSPVPVFTINSSANANGSISPLGDTLVSQGDDQVYSINADAGYITSEVIVDGVDQGSLNSFTFNNVNQNHTISASFSPVPAFNITSSVTANGSISPLGDILVSQGTDQLYSITADTGYSISRVIVDGVDQGPLNAFTFNNVTQNHTISASFEEQDEFVTFTLIDANTNTDLFNITNGAQVTNSTNALYNIRANSSITVGSIGFVLSGALSHTKTESAGPYALFGDKAGLYNGVSLTNGNYTLVATAYSGSGLTGSIIGIYSIQFSLNIDTNKSAELKKEIVKNESLGIEKPDILLFPNPASSVINIKASNFIPELIEVSIHDISGRLIKLFNVSLSRKLNYKFNISDLNEGVYFITLKTNKKTLANQKLIINN